MSDLRQRIANLSPDKRALLERQLLEKSRASGDARRIPLRAPAETYPLSHTQRRLWFLAQCQAESPVYNVSTAFRLRGALNADALQEALDAVVMRHEALRTTFRTVDGAPVQVIAPSAAASGTFLDLSALPEAEREIELARALRAECGRPFDLSRDLMLRTLLVRLGREEHALLLVTHHIVSDGFSSAILHRELSALYSARLRNAAPALQALPIQYADFACWQHSPSQEEMIQRQLAYWKRQLAGAPLDLELPGDRPRPASRTDGGARVNFDLPGKLVRSAAGLSTKPGITLFMTLLAAFDVLLHRYTGLEDLLVGTPIANRTKPELEDLIGFFANTLVMRADLSGNPTFLEILQRTCKTALDAYAHQDMPFDRLVEELRPARDLSRTPLIQVAFALQNTPAKALQLPGVEVERIEVQPGTAKFDLLLNMTETPEGLRAWFEYSTDLFERETVLWMAEHFRILLEGIVADPARRVSELPLMTEAERTRMVAAWNATAREYPSDKTVAQLFEAQVAKSPEAVAVVSEGSELRYGELNARANRLARRLRESGVGPNVPVGICAGRSPEMIVGLVAILKAGGAYVPLDPAYPPSRLASMLEDSGARVLLSEERVASRLPQGKARAILLDDPGGTSGEESAENPSSTAGPDDLAYVMYTSGSTGTPKGVAVPHRAIVRLVINTDYVTLGPSDAVAQASSCSFDAATFEIWGALLNGARLVLVPTGQLLSPADLETAVERYRINVMFLTTALFNELARQRPSLFGRLREVLFGGEAADARCAAEVLRRSPPGRLLHMYGPTETTTFATWHRVECVPEGAKTIPIGKPIANTTVYILDQSLNPVPMGAPGEIYIGGPGVARGYFNHPELSAERFIPSPFSGEPGVRLYRTGDLARRLPDGNIEFVGRKDQQVKIRGFRVEPAEIEAALGRHPAVREAVVIARPDASGNQYLAAYLVANGPPLPSAPEMRDFLARTLPDYMLPSAFTPIASIPLTPNGKVDRKALPAPIQGAPAEAGRVAPRDMVEKELALMWQALLGIPEVGIRDNFFDSGGHSLLAARLVAQVEKTFGKRLPLITVFEAPTIEKLANAVRGGGKAQGLSSMAAFHASGRRIPFFCVAPVHGFQFMHLARRLGPDQPFYAFHPGNLLDAASPDLKIEALAERYLRELRAVQAEGPYLLGGLCAGGIIAYEMAQQLQANGQNVALLALLDTYFPGGQSALGRFDRLAKRVAYHVAALRSLKAEDRVEYLRRKWVALKRRLTRNLRAPEDPLSVVAYIENPSPELLLAYRRILPGYAPRPYRGRTVLFLGSHTRVGFFSDSRRKWRRFVTGPIELYVVPGEHQGMLQEPAVHALAEKLRDCLAGARQS